MKRLGLLVLLAAALSIGASAESRASGRAAPHLEVQVAEWSIVPVSGVVAAGPVRIDVRNVGEQVHQVTLVRTSRFAAELPLAGDHAAVRPVAISRLVGAGRSTFFTVALRPGSYVLLDNQPWSYWRGTSVAFTVR